jgi:pimeloyl-ACP methyl ester carboxylesterase
MGKTIVFIHGMFLTPKCWDSWSRFFTDRGYRCVAPAWPWHEGDPRELRERIPVEAGHLALRDIVGEFAAVVEALPEKPILIGHAFGGLVVQILVNRGLARAGVCISSSPPNRMMTLDWGFLKSEAAIVNPLRGDKAYVMTEEEFRDSFCNTMTPEQTRAAYVEYAVHESRNVLRGSLGHEGHVDLRREHVPLLFIAGDEDRVIPEKLDRKNARAYAPEAGVVDFKEFAGHGHFICGEPGWDEVASYIDGWITAEPWMAANRLVGGE